MSTTTTTATATAAASSAASGRDSKGKVPALQTPVSASYPSELRSPLPGTPAHIKKEEYIKTPITPPSAYLDFLKALSPALMSPPTTSGSTSRFPSMEKSTSFEPANRVEELYHSTKAAPTSTSDASKPTSPPTTLSRQTSSDSTASTSSISSSSTSCSGSSNPSTIRTNHTTQHQNPRAKPQSPHIIIPPSPFAKPTSSTSSGRTPRRLHIPQSPFPASATGTGTQRSPLGSAYSTATGGMTTPWSATFSNTNDAFPKSSTSVRAPATSEEDTTTTAGAVAGSRNSKVCVRQVVTRTVTYCRTPLDPAPKGKRRKIEEEGSGGSGRDSEREGSRSGCEEEGKES